MASMRTFRVRTYDADGAPLKDFTTPDETDEGPEFYAHQLLHADDVVCVSIWDNDLTLDPNLAGDTPLLRRCDPGLEFKDVVR
jgi:hypothetical protein